MTNAESTTDQHARVAWQLLEDARREIATGDTVQGSEKALGRHRPGPESLLREPGIPHGKCAHNRHAVFELAEKLDNPFVRVTFGVAESCHPNFYNDWMEQEQLDGYLPDIEALVNIILDSAAS